MIGKSLIPQIAGLFVLPIALCAACLANDSPRRLSAEAKTSTAEVFLARKDFAKAELLLRRALDDDPNYGLALNLLGQSLAKQERDADAIEYYTQSINVEPENENFRLTLIDAYRRLSNATEMASSSREFLKKFPNSDKYAIVKELLRRAEAKNGLTAAAAGSESMGVHDYFLETTTTDTKRWDRASMPLRIFISRDASVPFYRPELSEIMKNAFLAWQNASQGGISVEFTADKNIADIICSWTAQPADLHGKERVGYCSSSFRDDKLVKSEVKILTCELGNQKLAASRESIVSSALHEAGHSLGIHGHSPRPKDIMYYSTLEASRISTSLSDRDKRTIYLLYPQTRATIAAKSSQQATGGQEVRSTQQIMQVTRSNGLSFDKGVDAMSRSDYLLAIECFKHVLDKTPLLHSARTNLGISYSGYAMKLDDEKQFDQAEIAYKQALETRRLLPDKHILDAAVKNYAAMLRDLKRTADADRVESEL